MVASEAMPAGACLVCHGTRSRVLFRKGGKDFVRCDACGLVWLDPMPTAAEVAAYYDQSYRDGIYEPYAAADTIRRLIAEHRLAEIRPHARPGRWLDVGAATGHFVEAAARSGLQAEGCEISGSAVARARERGLTIHHAGVEDFSPAAPYDTITAFDVLEHLREPRAFLDRLRAWLGAGRDARPHAARREQRLPAAPHGPALVLLRAERPPALLRPAHDHAAPRPSTASPACASGVRTSRSRSRTSCSSSGSSRRRSGASPGSPCVPCRPPCASGRSASTSAR
jgi:hypothetical protein